MKKKLFFGIVIFIFLLIFLDSAIAQNWWDSSWSKRQEINISNSEAVLTNFPAYIDINYDSDMQADYDDLRFINGSCGSGETLELDYEIEYYSGSKADVWVRIPSLETGITSICMYYGNSGASSGGNMNGVWDSNYVMIQHLQETSGYHYDSTQYNNNGTANVAVQGSASGKINGADKFNGSTGYVEVGTNNWNAGKGTIELWGYSYGFKAACCHYLFGHTTQPVWANRTQLYFDDAAGNLDLGFGNSHTRATNIQALNINTWYHIALTWDGTNYNVYVDGVSKASGTYTGFNKFTTIADIGNDGDTVGARNEAFNGTIDEVRVSNSTRSAEWINRSYQIVKNQASIISFGGEEIKPSPPTHNTPILSSSLGTNKTNEDLTCYNQSTSDPNGDKVKNIYNWYKDGNSIMVLNMPFEGGSNSTYTKDYSGFGHDGNVVSAIWNSTKGYDGFGAYEFDGANDSILDDDGENYINGLSAFTLSLWIKSDVTGTDRGFIIAEDPAGNDDVFTMRYDAVGASGGETNVIKAGVTVGAVQQIESSSNVQTTNWQHLALTWKSGGQLALYINGVLNTPTYNAAPFTGVISGATKLIIGKGGKDTTATTGWDGFIDDVKIYNISLSPEQIKALYENKTNFIVSNETSVGDTWLCEVTPNDGMFDGTTLQSNSLTIVTEAFISITLSTSSLDFGSGDPGATIPIIGQNNTTAAISVTNDNISTTNINLYLKGDDFIGAGTIGVGNVVYAEDNAKTNQASLTTSYPGTPYFSGIAPGSSEDLWYWISLPGGQVAGTYNSTFYFDGRNT